MLNFTTFSVVARCRRSGMLGVAISTAVPAVGAICPHASAGVGAIATQSFTNPYYGIDGLRLLAKGHSPEEAIATLTGADPGRERRQVLVVDSQGRSAAFTGTDTVNWKGHATGADFAIGGNMLTGAATLEAMVAAFAAHEPCDLPERLMRVLEAGQAAGGDKRGRQSAALRVVDQEAYPLCDLRVDEHAQPVAELRRILEIVKVQIFPYMATMPTRADPAGRRDVGVSELLLTPVGQRRKPV